MLGKCICFVLGVVCVGLFSYYNESTACTLVCFSGEPHHCLVLQCNSILRLMQFALRVLLNESLKFRNRSAMLAATRVCMLQVRPIKHFSTVVASFIF